MTPLLQLSATFLLLFSLSLIGTGIFLHYAQVKGLLDEPNHRSSHEVPTPTGGGIVAVGCILILWLAAGIIGYISIDQTLALIIPGMVVATVGFLDDKRHIPRRWRFLAHITAILIGLYFIYPLPELQIWKDIQINLSGPMTLLVIIALAWLTNLYNFMDGIDGIAASEAIFVLIGAGIILYSNNDSMYASLMWLAAAPILGLLAWNWPPAKLFMGDTCSTFLGLTFGLLALISTTEQNISIWSWCILLGVFIVDATWTLFRRIITGQSWRSSHREHLYQTLSPDKHSHLRTITACAIFNLVWLLPLAWIASTSEMGIIIMILAYIPLIFICLKAQTGTKKINTDL